MTTEMVVAQERSRISVLVGSIQERMLAFDQIAANIASLQLNGWDNVQKAKAACWLADGAGMHPAVFMQNHYCMILNNRLMVEPKWEFIVGTLQSRIPGFVFEVLIETDDCAKVRMSDGNNEHIVEYTIADAKRQGLLGRANAWKDNTREMCLKQAIKRCGRRIGAAALMDLPVGIEQTEFVPTLANGKPEKSTAEVIEDALGESGENDAASGRKADSGAPTGPSPQVPGQAATPAPPNEVDHRKRMRAVLCAFYKTKSMTAEQILEKASLLYNEMQKKATGVDPQVEFTKAGQIGPVEAQQIINFIEARMAAPAAPKQQPASEAVVEAVVEETEQDAPPPTDDDAPPAGEAVSAEPSAAPMSQADAFGTLQLTVARARKIKAFEGRNFIKEAPPGSGKVWFVDTAVYSEAGHGASVKLSVGPDIVASVEQLTQLNAILSAMCDKEERGGR